MILDDRCTSHPSLNHTTQVLQAAARLLQLLVVRLLRRCPWSQRPHHYIAICWSMLGWETLGSCSILYGAKKQICDQHIHYHMLTPRFVVYICTHLNPGLWMDTICKTLPFGHIQSMGCWDNMFVNHLQLPAHWTNPRRHHIRRCRKRWKWWPKNLNFRATLWGGHAQA